MFLNIILFLYFEYAYICTHMCNIVWVSGRTLCKTKGVFLYMKKMKQKERNLLISIKICCIKSNHLFHSVWFVLFFFCHGGRKGTKNNASMVAANPYSMHFILRWKMTVIHINLNCIAEFVPFFRAWNVVPWWDFDG